MEQDFRKKLFRGAKIEDTIKELENLSHLCEEKVKNSEQLDRQRFYEGMSMAYMSIALKLKGYFDYTDHDVIEHFYTAVTRGEGKNMTNNNEYIQTCSFCGKSKEEVGELALGPGVSICSECLKFGEAVIKSSSQSQNN